MANRSENIPFLIQRIALVITLIFPIGLAIFTQIQDISKDFDLYSTLLLAPLVIVFFSLMVYIQLSNRQGSEISAVILMIGFAISIRTATLLILSTDLSSDVLDVHNYAIDIVRGTPTSRMDQYTYIPEATYLTMTGLTHAIFYKLFGASVKTAKLLSVAIGAITCFLVYKTGKEVAGDRRTGLVAGTIFAAWPALIVYTGIPTSEHIAMSLIVLVTLISVFYSKSDKHDSWRFSLGMYALMGVVIGLVDWYRPVGVILLIAVLISGFLYLGKGELKLRWFAQIAVLVITYLVISQSAIQINRLVNGVPVPSNSQRLGQFILIGTNFETRGLHNWEDHGTAFAASQRFGDDFSGANRYLISVAMERIRDNFDQLPGLIEIKFRRVWQNDADLFETASVGSNDSELLGYANLVDDFCLIVISILIFLSSVFGLKKRSPGAVFLMQLFILGMALTLLVTEAQMRYRSILIPYSAILAAFGLKCLLDYLQGAIHTRRERKIHNSP